MHRKSGWRSCPAAVTRWPRLSRARSPHRPKFIGKPWWPVPVPMTMEDALKAHALAGLDRTVISNAVHYIRHMKSVKEVVAAIESSNRHLAKCRDLHPDKF